ncbi:DUF4349 domain-containing protein [Caproiciproducens galactitolivorans]|uniref:DUF4349 domain-containing protein n=1 Tax=Caproiciproducens galactitolivorans TaxID=642589 RepID=A0A4Z0YHL6_9FIRM|nr:DUF4349 domain-containing protein [Caproiciproducens galactitolivorans]QEY34906.1 DUF4349 domain-containing protein [Caproiciproducens galactitolivorans]TGJ76392.1 hypothetical protein CAGA_15990 [Caproiciproducens galactitolivorans]
MGNRTIRRFSVVLVSAAVLLGVFAACASSTPSSAPPKTSLAIGGRNTSAAGMADGAVKSEAKETAAESPSSQAASQARKAAGKEKIIEQLSYQIETLEFDESIKKIQSLCSKMGGYVQDSSVFGNSLVQKDLRSANYVLRIPQEKLVPFKNSAGSIGNILNFSSSSENISEKYYDTEARLKSLRTQQERLLALMQKSGSLADVVALEKALADVNYQIEELTGTLRKYDSLIDYSTVNIQLNEVVKPTELEKTPVSVGDKIQKQFKDSLRALGGFGEGVLVFLIGGSPILLPLVLIAIVVAFLIRKKRKQAKKENKQPVAPLLTKSLSDEKKEEPENKT